MHSVATDARDCPVCGARPSGAIGRKDGVRLFRCAVCTAQYAERAPEDASLPEIYDAHYFNGAPAGYPDYQRDEAVHRARARTYLRDIGRVRQAPGRVLDVGCATGFFLDEARRDGWTVRGCDASAWAAEQASRNLGLDVVVGPFPHPALEGDRFDLVTFFNVFEQLLDPRAAEAFLRALVKPGGLVAIETWDADALVVRLLGTRWHQYRPRETPVYFNRRSLQALFRPPRWELVAYRPCTKRISLRNGFHVLGLELPANGGRSFAARLGNLTVPYRLGDLVWVLLRRRADAV